jgi:hypothetical protein
MSRHRLEDLLQECLAAYDAGLSPEECLSAFPAQRLELEPMLRQALSLRIAYSAAPAEEFRGRLRQKLMFAAGREVSQAFETTPAPEFTASLRDKVMFAAGREVQEALTANPEDEFYFRARAHLLEASGASAQEALRAVPPPRLPFGVNARRRLLEAATASRPQARPHRARPLALSGLSVAALILAFTLATIGYIATQSSRPTGVSADIEVLEEQLRQVEEQTRAGRIIPPGVIVELTAKTTQILEKVASEPAALPETGEKLQSIIDRQQQVVTQVQAAAPAAPELQKVKADLDQAELRLAAARAESPTPAPTQSQAAAPSPTNAPATATPVPATPTPAGPATPVPTAAPPQGNEVRLTLAAGDTTLGTTWLEVRTANLRFLIPASWEPNVAVNDQGISVVETGYLVINSAGVTLLVNLESAEFNAIVNGGTPFVLRTEGGDGDLISDADLAARAGSSAAILEHIVDSIDLTGAPASQTPGPVPTSTATPTLTPSGTATTTP